MNLTHLDIRRLPGITRSFALVPRPGVNLVVGPNASGKSSTARAVRDLLWPARHEGGVRWLRAVFEDGDGELTATCDGPPPVWSRGGAPVPPPTLPPAHLADCYRLSAADLMGAANALDRDLAAAIRTEMTGGFDLDGLGRSVERPSLRGLRERERAWRAAREDAATVERAQAELAARRDSLAELEERIAAADAAVRRRDALAARRQALAARRARDDAQAARAAFPPVMDAVRPDDAETFAHLRATLAARRAREAEAAAEAAEQERRLRDLAVPEGVDAAAELARVSSLVAACRETARTAALAAERRTTLARALQAAGPAPGEPDADAEVPGADVLAGLHRTLQGLDATLAALTAEADVEPPPPAGRGRATGLLIAAAALILVAALPLLPQVGWRVGAAAAALVLTGLGAADWAAVGSQRRDREARLEQRERMATAAVEARARRDDLAARADELAAAEAAAAEADLRLAADLAAAGAGFAPWELPAPTTAGAAEAQLDNLRDRVQRRAEGQAILDRARRDGDEAARDADAAETQLASLLARLHLPPDTNEQAPVQDLVDRLAAWRTADEAWRRADAACASLDADARRRAEAAGLPEPGGDAGNDDAALAAAIAAADAEAEAAAGLREQLGSLRQELRTADAGHTLADALARERTAADDLSAWTGEARDRLAEAALLDELRTRHETLAAPPRLREASRLLGEFTRGRYALTLVADGDGPGFRAEDRESGEVLQLDELSDGTRIQLLLAVRVAFVGTIETGAHPPLFLDEALATSDPQRLAAVAVSLARLAAATGRQVFYLTSQPADVGAWRGSLRAADLPEPTFLDLAIARGEGVAAGPDQLAPAPVPPVPAPDGRDAAGYGALLKVAALDPRRPWQEVDTFHLAAPDLDLVRRLRVAGLGAAGPLAAALPRLGELGVEDEARRDGLATAVAVLRALLAAWRIGRPRRVEIADVDASGAVSDVFRPRVLQVLREHGWQAESFLAAVAAGAVPNFRRNKLEQLREHLADAGCLDDRAPLDDEALVTEVLLRLAPAAQTKARTSVEEARALVLRLRRAMSAGGEAAL